MTHFQTRLRLVGLVERGFRLGDRRTVQVTLPAGEDGSPFHLERLIVISTVARHFVFRGMRVDEREKFANAEETPVPAACFKESVYAPLVGPGSVFSLDVERTVPFERVPWWKRALRFFGLLLPPPLPCSSTSWAPSSARSCAMHFRRWARTHRPCRARGRRSHTSTTSARGDRAHSRSAVCRTNDRLRRASPRGKSAVSVAMKRTKQLNLKLSEEELSALQQLALSYGISEQNVLRMLVRRDHLERSAHKRTMGLEELGEQIARHLDGARRRRNEKR